MEKKSNTVFEIRPHPLHSSFRYSCEEVVQEDIPIFFRDLGRYMRQNPHMELEDIRMSYMGYNSGESRYLFEIHWVNNDES